MGVSSFEGHGHLLVDIRMLPIIIVAVLAIVAMIVRIDVRLIRRGRTIQNLTNRT